MVLLDYALQGRCYAKQRGKITKTQTKLKQKQNYIRLLSSFSKFTQNYTAWDFQNHLTSPWAVKAARVSTAEQRWMPSPQTWELLREEDEFGEPSYEKLDCLSKKPT